MLTLPRGYRRKEDSLSLQVLLALNFLAISYALARKPLKLTID